MVSFLNLGGFFFSLPCGHIEERAVQLKECSKGRLPPPFPFQKKKLCALELLHRQKTYNAVVSIVLMCGTFEKKKKIHTKGVGRTGASRE